MNYHNYNTNRKEYQDWLKRNRRLYAPIHRIVKSTKLTKHQKKKGPLKYLKNGYLPQQEWGALILSWQGFRISRGHMDDRLCQWYAAGIQRFANDLHLRVPDFPELKMLALSFYEDNAEYLQDEMSPQEVFDKMIERDFEFLKEEIENR